MSDAASPDLITPLLALGPGGLVAVLAIAWGRQQRTDAVQARADLKAAQDANVANVTKLTEALALSREQDRRTESALVEQRQALERSGAHRIVTP